MLMAQGPAGIRAGGRVAAYVAGGPAAYPAAGGTAWIPPAAILASFAICLPIAAIAIARYRRQSLDIRQGRQPLRGRQLARAQRIATDPATMLARTRGRTSMAFAGTIVLIMGQWFGLFAAVTALPPAPPSATLIACADYGAWAQAQDFSGPPDKVSYLLAEASKEAPPGPLASGLSVLSSDVQAEIADYQGGTLPLAGMNVATDMGVVTKQCHTSAS
jgi:hypothetical protein